MTTPFDYNAIFYFVENPSAWAEGFDQRVSDHIAKALAEIERLQGLVYVPGLWRCAKCEFRLVQRNLNMASGAVTARDDAGDRCPNCTGPLWRISERHVRQEVEADVERLVLEMAGAKP